MSDDHHRAEHRPGEPRGNAFFGRRKGKTLRKGQAERLEADLPKLSLDLTTSAPDWLADLFPSAPAELRLEIGFGGGEHLIHRALERPDVGFIGVEPFVNGMTKALGRIATEGTSNIRLSGEDGVKVLDWLPEASLDRVLLLYPDPWPKKRHWKRRFVGPDTVDRFARVLKDGGEFWFASDIDTYVDWTLRHVRANSAFVWTASAPDDWRQPWEGWPGTRYEAKARREGRGSAYLTFRRLPRR
ncbi:tRNA (guanosine(46)-N7)-methyltransferase TrmB [Pleomorphomonas oryzae]|uniref:tRNA (guanosine(46)-N7)-methyltransferase TrmB n=1 Tax=Pleomorphomonas oryzae TaxID=261934 RepID=UPI000685D063|nr:tRNA (guanosine(46)-N7)-methyltransferase TrmB [Pleomorphomonas oryzae]